MLKKLIKLKVVLTALVIGISGVLSLLIWKRQGTEKVLEKAKENLERQKKTYEKSRADTHKEEKRVNEKITEIEERIREPHPKPSDGDAAAVRLRELMGW